MKTKYVINNLLAKFGYAIVKKHTLSSKAVPQDLKEEKEFMQAYSRCKPHTKIHPGGVYTFWKVTEYITQKKIPGAIVECGVWRGGGIMASVLQLVRLGETQRKIYLYDTYKGMSEPTEKDVNFKDHDASSRWRREQQDGYNTWDYGPLELVKRNVFSTGYPEGKFVFVEGKVEDTLPKTVPDQIAILRIDTDWYESTKHALTHLFPRISPGGVLLLDDYGVWRGARRAVDEFFEENKTSILLHRIDNTGGRVGIKEKV